MIKNQKIYSTYFSCLFWLHLSQRWISLQNENYDSIQYEHYIDNGCFCKACWVKRRNIYLKLSRKEVISEKIIHNDAVEDLINKTNDILNKKVRNIKKEKRGVDFVKIKYM